MTVTSGESPGREARRFTFAVDPGPTQSAWVLVDSETRFPSAHGKDDNDVALEVVRQCAADAGIERIAIEMIASYGMTVGAEVFETCVWIGRFEQAARDAGQAPVRIKRQPVKMHHCHSARATDANVTQALVDRFAYGEPNRGKGTKAKPGWFYAFAADVWQAYALGVYAADERIS